MRRELSASKVKRLTIWTGHDGPVPLPPGSTGVEFRGRLGHPSSYGLLAGQLADRGELVGAGSGLLSTPPDVPNEVVTLGLHEHEYIDAINRVISKVRIGLRGTAAAEGRFGSSAVVFTRLAVILARVLGSDAESITAQELWTEWDDAWPSRTV